MNPEVFNIKSFLSYVDWPYLLVFMLLTYFMLDFIHTMIQYYFNRILRKRLIVFALGTMIALPFVFYFKHDPLNLLVTWSFGLAMHDYFMVFFIDNLKLILTTVATGIVNKIKSFFS